MVVYSTWLVVWSLTIQAAAAAAESRNSSPTTEYTRIMLQSVLYAAEWWRTIFVLFAALEHAAVGRPPPQWQTRLIHYVAVSSAQLFEE